jgi:thiol-disulfide isomerase/thioredoxin/YHS domain-containing protein
MSLRAFVTCALATFCLTIATNSVDAAGVAWRHDLKKAAAESERTGKPILLQVTAEWCGYCHKMLRETFPDEKLAKKINDCFIPVVLDADKNEKIVDAIGISAFPSTIVISPELDVIGRVRGFHTPRSLEKKLAPFCKKKQNTVAASVTPVSKPAKTESANEESVGKKVENRAEELPEKFVPRLPTLSIPAVSVRPLVPEPAFEGLCLVSMLNGRIRTEGEKMHSTVFQKQRLQFASKENLNEFLADPMKYWPLLGGRCPVAVAREDKDLHGDPQTVAVFQGKLVFFKDLSHREDFSKNPRGYFQQATATQK